MAMSRTFMSPDFLTKFLEEYRNLPVLWQVSSPDYSSRAKRDAAWDLLLQFTREKLPDVDLAFLKKRVDSFRASFRKELRRIRDNKRKDASKNNAYKPTLWYFDLLSFTANQEDSLKNKGNLDEDNADGLDTISEIPDDSWQNKITKTSDESKRTAEMILEPPLRKRKKTSLNTSITDGAGYAYCENLTKCAMDALNQQDDEYHNLGKTYAAKLRRMPDTQRDIADKLINDVLFKGLMSHLTSSTCISD